MTASEVHVVGSWHDALNDGDVERLVSLSHPDIEVGGPRGTGRGTQLLREWVGRAGVHLNPRRVFHHGDTVSVEQEAKWRSADSGEVAGDQIVASVFIVRDGRIVSVLRYPGLAEALRAANLNESYEVRPD